MTDATLVESTPRDPRDQARRVLRRLLRGAFALTMAFSTLLFLVRAVRIFHVGTLWDDAYMFQRYAHNLVSEHRIAWNPRGQPTYGLTSPAFLAVVVPIFALTGKTPALSATLASALPGLAFLALLALLLLRYVDAARAPKLVALALTALCMANANTTDHLASGMDTTFVLAFATLYLIAAHRAARAPETRWAVALGVLGGFAYFVRPELLLYSVLVPGAMAAFAPDRATRRCGVLALAMTFVVSGLELAACAAYFHSPLPLPFYAKSTGLYGTTIFQVYRGVSSLELLAFAGAYWPLFAIIALDGIDTASRFRTLDAASAVYRGVLGATLLFIGYHWFIVLPVMHYASRFYQPLVPALAYLGAHALGRWWTVVRTAGFAAPRGAAEAVAFGAMALACSQMAPPLFTTAKDLLSAVLQHQFPDFDIQAFATTAGPRGYWYGIDSFSKLPDDLVIATSEVGMPCALSPNRTIVDLAGLNETDFARKPFSADWLFSRYHPDLVYMPHSVYTAVTKAIEASAAFKGYDVYTRAELGTKDFGLAIRRDSPHYDAMRAIMGKKKPR